MYEVVYILHSLHFGGVAEKKQSEWETASQERDCFLYHSIVFRNPSSKLVFAANPNLSRARDVSSIRRGCPLGFVVSQTTRP